MMGFLQNIFGKAAKGAIDDPIELPTRTRTFSASAFREAEIARENEAWHRREKSQLESSNVLSPAIAPVAEVLMAQQSIDAAAAAFDSDQAPEVAPPAAAVEPCDASPLAAASPPQDDPMSWEDAAGWLSQRSAASRNLVAQYWNWEHDPRVVEFLVRQPDLDPGVAAGILWITAANEDYFPWGDDEPNSEFDQTVSTITELVGRRFDAGDFLPMAHGFDDSWDCERLKERLVDLFGEGRIDWNPGDLPTSSAAPMMSFDDLPEDERDEVIAFLARHGVR